jgi:TolA-binding protein
VEALQPRRAPRQIAAATPEVPTTERVGEPVLPLDAESLYRSAEEELATGRVDRGKELLKQIVAGYPSDLLVGPAIYELGRIAFAAKDFAQARNEFERVRASRHSAVARFQEPAAFLICKSELELGHRSATNRCFEQYRADFPDSPHAADALALLASQTYRDQGCAQATPLFDEYLARFAGGSYAPEARVALNRCRH